jgi:hypothetical protein
MIAVKDLFTKIADRQFEAADAKEFLKSSYYFAGTHPDVHIILSVRRPADFHFQQVPKYEERSQHSMFMSMDDAASAIAASLNCEAGEAALRFLSVSGVEKVALYSRSGARKAETMIVRAATASMGNRTGTMYGTEKTDVVVVVLSIFSGSVVLTTAYPAHMLPQNRPKPPQGSDLLEYSKQCFTYRAA